jgi:hypothetical protein
VYTLENYFYYVSLAGDKYGMKNGYI